MAGKEEEFSAPMEPELKSVCSEAMSGCGKKRKAEETEEEAAVDVVVLGLPGSERMIRQDYSESEDDDEKVNEDEDPEVIFARIKAKFEARLRESDEEVTYEDDSEESDSEESDSDEDEETIYAKIKAKFDASTREHEALFPDQTYGDCFLEEESHDDDEDELGDVVDEAIPA